MCEIPSTSRPRAATSVPTRTGYSPRRNASSAAIRVLLPAVGVDAGGTHAAAGDRARELVGVALPLDEDEYGMHRLAPQQRREERPLPRLCHRIDAVHDAAHRLLRAHHD